MKFILCLMLVSNVASIPAVAAERSCMKMTERASSSAPESSNVKITNITPQAGSTLHMWTVLVVDLEYYVKDFDSGDYILTAQFGMTKEGSSMDGSFSFSNYPHLSYASGSFRLCFPLKDVWNYPSVKRPFSVRFFLSKMDNPHHFHPVAKTEPLIFPAG